MKSPIWRELRRCEKLGAYRRVDITRSDMGLNPCKEDNESIRETAINEVRQTD